jgi:arginyl-tRNA synthetase
MKDHIQGAIVVALKSLGIEGATFVVDYPTDKNTEADFFSNVAMSVSKQMGQSPRAVAEQLQTLLAGKIDQVTSIEVAGPGFLNFYLDRNFYTEALKKVDTEFGKNNSWAGKKVLVEYTDPNPFKEFHVGHLFTNAVGESIARLFMMGGADTKRVNYQGDVGLHVAHAIWGVHKLNAVAGIDKALVLSPEVLGKAYALGATAYKEDETAAAEIRVINKAVYDRTNEQINTLYDHGRKVSLDYFETIYQLVDTQFDEYFFESEASAAGKELVLNNPDIFVESDGARVFAGETYGLHTRVFLNRECLPTYEAKELALAQLKHERFGGYDHSIISTANEINEYFKVLKKAMSFVYPELEKKTEHIGHGMVRLSTGKMSSRTGDVIAAKTFIAEVASAAQEKLTVDNNQLATDIAIAAIKYATLKGDVTQDTIFDKEKALSFEGDSGPYLQYTHARICSVLTKAAIAGIGASFTHAPVAAYKIETLVYQFQGVVADALLERAPHKVTQYLTELAGEFNSFYAHEKIADPTDEYAPYKVAVTTAVRQTLKNGLWVLGIKAPERM